MRVLVLAAVLGFGALYAQNPAKGGEEAVTTGGPTAAGQGHAATREQANAEAATKHGEAGQEAEMPNELWWKWANFAILAIALGYLIGKNAGPFFRTRSDGIRRGIEEATRAREDAERRAAEIERRVSNLAAEVEQMRAQSRQEIAREGERIRAETEAQIRKVQAQSEVEIQSAAKHATHDLKTFSAQLALQLAGEQLRNQMNGTAQDGLTDAFITDLRERAVRH